MGCLGSRPQNEEKASSDNLYNLLDQLTEGQFVETIIIYTSVYNYCYIKQRKEWVLQKKRIIKSADKWMQSNLESRNYMHSFLDSHPQSIILLRPLRNFKPAITQATIHTTLMKNDFFPQQIFVKFVDVKQAQLINFSNNGKYTFFLQLQLYKLQSLKQFYKFQQIITIKISKIFKFAQFEFYGLINWTSTHKYADLQKFINKYGWHMKFIDISENVPEHHQYFNPNQVFHIEESTKEDIFIIIDPQGKVIRAETPEFYVSKKPDQACEEFDDVSSQKSKAIKYEKKLLKELHIHYSSYISKNKPQTPKPTLTKQQILQQQIYQSSETISYVQYKDFKQLFKSARLPQILSKYHPGEPFQFELIKQIYFNYDFDEQKFKEVSKSYLLPSIYPAASIQKQKILTETCRELKESIGLRWKDPDLNVYSIPHTYTFNKIDLMDFLQDFTQQFHFKLKLFLIKRRSIEWQTEQKSESKIMRVRDQDKVEWTNQMRDSFVFLDIYELHNKSIAIKNLDELKLLKQQQEQHIIQFKSIKTQNLCSNGMNLIRKYIYHGIDYQISINEKLMDFDESIKITNNTLLFVLYDDFEKQILIILNKLASVEDEFQEPTNIIIITQLENHSNIIKEFITQRIQKLQIQFCHFNQVWNQNTGLSFKSDIIEKYFNVRRDYKTFYIDKYGYLMAIQSNDEFIDAIWTNNQNQIIVDWFIQQFGMTHKNDDSEWKQIKQECCQFNQKYEEIVSRYEIPKQMIVTIKSIKCLLWDSHNYSFLEYSNCPTITHNLNVKQIALLNIFIPNIIKLII
ncbi:unnamed protein product [Paramecium octaurelia]|uniref:Uncharacterized protein n=1 Tax=Paramecium octaurelia TaxID=43137 RepID=A0A8S1XDY9_PAROT|nr:unnamed protein product [Paramecium octaurelia]